MVNIENCNCGNEMKLEKINKKVNGWNITIQLHWCDKCGEHYIESTEIM